MNLVFRPIIYVITVCYNEARFLPFFLEHYIHFIGATRVILYDGGSTDGSDSIAAQYPEVEFKVKPSEKLDDRDLLLIKNEEWKQFRNECDWMIVCDTDEILYCPNPTDLLQELKKAGTTLPLVEGYQMFGKSFPKLISGKYLWQEYQTGIKDPVSLNKCLIFDPKIDINYNLGCHSCNPVGPVVRSEGFVFKNLHYCMLSYDFVVGKSKRVVERLSEWNVQIGAGHHRKTHSCMSQLEFNRMYFKASNVFQPISAPTSIPQAMHGIVRLLLEADTDSQIVELGTEQYFGEPTDGGSTEFYAWFVHNYGGHFVSIDSDPKVTRHAETELLARHGETPRTKLITGSSRDVQASDGQLWSLIHLSGRHNQGNEMNQVEAAIITLNDFIRVEPQLDETGLVVIDERREDVVFQGHSRYLVYYLLGRGYKPHLAGRFVIFARRNLVEA